MDPALNNGQPTDDEILNSVQPDPGAPAGEPAAAAPADTFNAQELAYKFRNETVYPKDRNEAIELLQLGHSFRVNKPKWEQDRQALQAFEARKEEYQRYDQLSQALQANPEFRKELETLAQKYSGQPSAPAQPQVSPEIAPVLETVTKLEQWKQQQEAREADNELSRELDALEKSETGFDWKTDTGEGTLRQQLLRYMSENQVYNPKIAFAGLKWGEAQQKARFEAEKKAAEEAAKARKAGVVVPGAGPAPSAAPQSIDHRKMSYDDLENAALESIRR